MASGSGRPCPCEPQVHLAPVVDLINFSLESITIHKYSHTVAGVQLLALLHYIELQFRNSRPIHVTFVNPCLCMASAYDLSCVLKFVLKFVKIFVLKCFFGCAQACICRPGPHTALLRPPNWWERLAARSLRTPPRSRPFGPVYLTPIFSWHPIFVFLKFHWSQPPCR